MYEDSVNAFRDIVNAIRSAEKKKFAEGRAKGLAEGRAEGLAEGRAEIVRAMLARGMAKDLIAELTGMSVDDINRL